MFKYINKDTRTLDVVLVSLLIPANIFFTFYSKLSIIELEQVNIC